MSYASIYQCANDQEFLGRLMAAAADEGAADPFGESNRLKWPVSSTDDIEAAYASALAAGNEHPGGDPTVITDGMILSAVQANPAPPAP